MTRPRPHNFPVHFLQMFKGLFVLLVKNVNQPTSTRLWFGWLERVDNLYGLITVSATSQRKSQPTYWKRRQEFPKQKHSKYQLIFHLIFFCRFCHGNWQDLGPHFSGTDVFGSKTREFCKEATESPSNSQNAMRFLRGDVRKLLCFSKVDGKSWPVQSNPSTTKKWRGSWTATWRCLFLRLQKTKEELKKSQQPLGSGGFFGKFHGWEVV